MGPTMERALGSNLPHFTGEEPVARRVGPLKVAQSAGSRLQGALLGILPDPHPILPCPGNSDPHPWHSRSLPMVSEYRG